MADLIEKKLSSELIFDGKVVHLYKDTVSLPNGNTSTREYIKHVGAVCVVPLTSDGNVLCVRQYRYPLSRTVIEIPAGKLDFKEEDPLSAAKRELREETGAVAGKLTYLGRYYSSPAILDECIHMYLAEDLSFGETDFDEDEFIENESIPLCTLVDMILDGKITDGKTQAAVLKAALLLGKNRDAVR
ncbi:MAG: NUDIX domain-containing protein [Eubacteriales bacterium]